MVLERATLIARRVINEDLIYLASEYDKRKAYCRHINSREDFYDIYYRRYTWRSRYRQTK